MSEGAPGVRVTSEIGRLRRVLCHEPGPELSIVTPTNRAAYLFDDLLDMEEARAEHRRFRAILERFADVREVGDLLAEALAVPEARAFVLARADEGLREWAEGAEPETLARLFIEGKRTERPRSSGESLAELMNEAGYLLPPLPNLFFTRDAACVVDDAVVVAAMAHEVRWSEELVMRTLFGFHPLLTAGGGLAYDGTRERRLNTSIEGGDVHVLRRDLLLVGLSERTSASGVDRLARALFDGTAIRDVLVVVMPRHRTSIHLDMVFTMIDREMCCVFPPYFTGPTRLPVLRLSRDAASVREMPSLFEALRELDLALEPIFCGGPRRTQQEREQWGSGCNLFALGPGRLVAYDRNDETLGALERDGGYRIVEGVEFLTGDELVEEEGRFVITFRGSELVRGGGGPRCMTLPVLRDEPT